MASNGYVSASKNVDILCKAIICVLELEYSISFKHLDEGCTVHYVTIVL